MKNRFSVFPAVYAIVRSQGEFLFRRRANTGYKDGFLGLASGSVEAEESLSEACARELFEEIGIYVRPDELKFSCLMYRQTTHRTRVDVFFELEISDKNSVKNCETHLCSEILWLKKEDINKKEVIPYIHRVLMGTFKKPLIECVEDMYGEMGDYI